MYLSPFSCFFGFNLVILSFTQTSCLDWKAEEHNTHSSASSSIIKVLLTTDSSACKNHEESYEETDAMHELQKFDIKTMSAPLEECTFWHENIMRQLEVGSSLGVLH